MNNKEIRARALSKVKGQISNLSFIIVISYMLQKILGLFTMATGTALDVILGVAAHILISLLTAGTAKVAITAWREGRASWRDLFSGFAGVRMFLCGLYGGVLAAMFGLLSNVIYMFAPEIAGYAASVVLDWAAALCTGYIVFAADLFEKLAPIDAARKGMSVLTKRLARVIKMELNLYWWIIVALALVFVLTGVIGGVAGIPLRMVLFLVMLALKWAVGAYIALCEAGLARTLMKG